MKQQRAKFGSKLGVILASAGSAVGLGNVWRFPYEAGNNGGAAFIIIYLISVVLIGMPIIISEFMIGRRSKVNTAGAYKKLAPHTSWKWVGRLGVLTGFLILCYYVVVAGWTLEYIYQSLINSFHGQDKDFFVNQFTTFSQGIFRPILWLVVFMLLTHFIIVRGVEKGIEKSSKIMMPLLLILIIVLVGFSVSLPGAQAGIDFLIIPDWGKVTPKVVLSAVGQAFFSLSIGMGCLCTYASYFSKETKLGRTAVSVGLIDTFIAILAGFLIFPAAFSVGIEPGAGPSLVFVTLPNVFEHAFGGIPILAYLFSLLFYVLLAMAALTSTISIHEVITAYIHEEFHLGRKKAARVVTSTCIVIGMFCSLSLGPLSDLTLFDLNLFSLFDFVTAKILLPVGGVFISIFAGWYLDKKGIFKEEISTGGSIYPWLYKLLIILLRYVAPIAIFLVFLNQFGFFQ